MEYYLFTPISLLLRFFEIFAQFNVVATLTNIKTCKRKMLLMISIYVALFEVVRKLSPQYLLGIISIICTIIFFVTIFKTKWWKTIIAVLLLGISTAILDCVISFSLVGIFKLDSLKEIIENQAIYSIDSLLISAGLILIAFVINLLKNKNGMKNNDSADEQINKSGMISNIITFLVLMPNLITILYYHDNKELPFSIIIINICAIIAMFFINAYNTQKTYEAIRIEQTLKIQKECNTVLQEMVDGLRSFKHDYTNTLQTLYGYARLNNMEKLKEVLIQIIDEGKTINSLGKLNPNVIKNPSLYGLLISKNEKAIKNNVKMDLEILGDIEKLDIPIFDLTRVLGIFLDNAIEAAIGSKRKRITFMITERPYEVSIEIINTYSKSQLQAITLYKKGNSTKGEGRGLGLCKAKEIIAKYPDILHQTLISNEQFMQSITIPKVREDYKK